MGWLSSVSVARLGRRAKKGAPRDIRQSGGCALRRFSIRTGRSQRLKDQEFHGVAADAAETDSTGVRPPVHSLRESPLNAECAVLTTATGGAIHPQTADVSGANPRRPGARHCCRNPRRIFPGRPLVHPFPMTAFGLVSQSTHLRGNPRSDASNLLAVSPSLCLPQLPGLMFSETFPRSPI